MGTDSQKGYYLLKADLLDAYVNEEGKLVLLFDKRNSPETSVAYLRGMKGFLVCHFKKA